MGSDPIKILIVDDDERVLIELERLLESEGYSTTTAWDGPEALAYTEQMQFDVLLVDEDMTHSECNPLSAELKRRQPRAWFLQKSSRATWLPSPGESSAGQSQAPTSPRRQG